MFTFSIDGDERIFDKLDLAIKKIENPKQILGKTGDLLIQEFKENFPQEGGNLNEKWEPLALSTITQRLRLGFSAGPILVRTGNLMRGFKKAVSRFQVRVYNPVSYFKYHQRGTDDIPQRRMIHSPEWLKQEIVSVFAEYVRKIFL